MPGRKLSLHALLQACAKRLPHPANTSLMKTLILRSEYMRDDQVSMLVIAACKTVPKHISAGYEDLEQAPVACIWRPRRGPQNP